MDLADEIARREARQRQLAEAKVVLEQRAQARYEAEKAEYDESRRVRPKPRSAGKSHGAVRRSRRSRDPAIRISTISRTRTRAL